MDGFGTVFGAVALGLVAGFFGYVASGETAWVGWVVGLAAGGTLFWKLLNEDT